MSLADEAKLGTADSVGLADQGLQAAQDLLANARPALRDMITKASRKGMPDECQFEMHGFAWFSTYEEALRQMLDWARELEGEGRFNAMEQTILLVATSEYLSQIAGGVPMNQGELVRPSHLGISAEALDKFNRRAGVAMAAGRSPQLRVALAQMASEGLASGRFGNLVLDETLVIRI